MSFHFWGACDCCGTKFAGTDDCHGCGHPIQKHRLDAWRRQRAAVAQIEARGAEAFARTAAGVALAGGPRRKVATPQAPQPPRVGVLGAAALALTAFVAGRIMR